MPVGPKPPLLPKSPKIPRMPGIPAPKRLGGPPRSLNGEIEGVLEDPGMGMGGFGPDPSEKLAMWIEGLYEKGQPVGRLQLCQKSPYGISPLTGWDNAEFEGQDPGAIATMIYGAAQEDAQSNSGVTYYVVRAYRDPEDTMHFAMTQFRVMQEDFQGGVDSEPGHLAEGHMAQAHRHSEIYMRMVVGMASDTMRTLREQNRELAGQAMQGMRLQLETIKLHQNLLDRRLMRKIYLRKMDAREKRKEQVVDYMMRFLPDVATKLGFAPSGQKQFLEDVQVMMAIVGRLPKNQLDAWAAQLPSDKAREAFGRFAIEARRRVEESELSGGKAGKQLGQGSKEGAADKAIEKAPVAEAAPAPPPKPIQLSESKGEVKLLESVCVILARAFARLDPTLMRKMITGPDEERKIIEDACEAGAALNERKTSKATPAESAKIQQMQPFVIATLVQSKDEAMALMKRFIGEKGMAKVMKLREILKGKVRS